MQLLLLGLFAAIFLHDATTFVEVGQGGASVRAEEALPGDTWPMLGAWPVILLVLLPKLLLSGFYSLACHHTRRVLGTAKGKRSHNRLEAFTAALPLLLLMLFVSDLAIGGLRTLRIPLQHTVLIDELLVMLPTLLTVIASWAMYYPVDRRLREAVIMRDADAGKPVYPLLSRGGYVTIQLRHQFGLVLLPLLMVLCWYETIVLLGPDFHCVISNQAAQVLSPIGVLAIFICSPLVIRYVWQTRPLPPGEVRDRMLALCHQHKVRVRELLLWQTSGRMINAAVAGLISKVRYILLSDGLLDQLGPREIEAVMAHELGHVKCKHLIWMGAAIIALLGTLEGGGYALLENTVVTIEDPTLRILAVSAPSLIIALLAFGWVSRRVERQADVFAIRHLAMTSQTKAYDASGTQLFDQEAVDTMVHALQRVAVLNHVPLTPKSRRENLMHWRHGSIAWRQGHLRSLIGTPINQTPVDRVLNKVKLATLLGLGIATLFYFF